MYQYDELKKFLNSTTNDGIDFEKVLKDLEILIYYTAKNRGKKLSFDQVEEAKAQFISDLLSLSRPIHDGFGYCLAHVVRLIYWASGSRFNHVSLDDVSDEVSLISSINPSWNFDSEFSLEFLNIFDSYLLHPKLKEYLLSLKSLDQDLVLSIIKSDKFLGVLLKVAYLRHKFMPPMCKVVGIGNLNTREEEVLLGVVMTKINKDWTLSQYILMREIFLINLVTFLDPLIDKINKLYKKEVLRNLLLAVRVYCYYEKLCEDVGVEGAISACGHKFNICNRFVKQKINRIERILSNYDRIIERRIKQFQRTVCIIERESEQKGDNLVGVSE